MVAKSDFFSILCGVFAVGGTLASLLTDCWQINSKGSVVLSVRCRGLWRECVWDSFVKIWTCDGFSSYLNSHPVSVVITRGLLIGSSLLSSVAFLFLLLGFRHFHCCREERTRRQLQRLSVGVNFLAGLAIFAGVIGYCTHVYEKHQFEVSLNIPGFPGFEFGYSLWLAAAASLNAIMTAILTARESFCLKSAMKKTSGRDQDSPLQQQAISTYV